MSSADPEIAVRHHRLQRMIGRDPNESHRGASPLELLFDLTFVVAFAQAGNQVAHLVAEGHITTAVIGFVFVMLSVCWAWINFTWFASAFDTDDWFQRAMTILQMVGVVVLALGIPDVFHSIDDGEPLDYTVVAAGYIVMRVALLGMWLRVARQDPRHRRVALRYAGVNLVLQVCWAIVAFSHIPDVVVLAVLLTLLWALEFVGPAFATAFSRRVSQTWQGTPWNARHIVERYGLLMIITLGEGILGTVTAVAAVVEHSEWSGEAVLVVVAGVGLTVGLWWSYFIIPWAPVLRAHRNRSWGWGYGHIALYAAVAAVGAGLHVAAYAAEDETTIGTVGVTLAVAVPVLIFCVVYFVLYSVLFRAVDSFHLKLAAGMIAFLALGVGLASVGVPLGWCLLAVMLSPYVVVVGYETSGYRHVLADVAREA